MQLSVQSNWIRGVLLLLSIAGFSGGLAGFQSGWAWARKDVSHNEWAPEIAIELSVGWWDSLSHIKTGFVPVQIELQGKGGRALGLVTALALAGSSAVCVLVLANILASAMPLLLPKQLLLSSTQKYLTVGRAALCVIPFTVLLYGVITFKVHDEVHKKVHLGTQAPDVWPYPGWACLSAAVGGVALVLSTFSFKADLLPSPLEGYLPL
ncbi:hypothetical protein DUNSADRAFT_17069 [Dunaliella salina]|uniref:Uncharacterized protein n=1 Tax=Dunaliella salina TaxID=3046 RepID=A0ABQ7H0I5_DUNSA|nr:hypothetical protein DUNSADRAFT_17069 [Dunaliella salina]|eukprot:KAF5840371.1 hypothetical protein DUNSADRAFT_17069 [Dunaliella salina]